MPAPARRLPPTWAAALVLLLPLACASPPPATAAPPPAGPEPLELPAGWLAPSPAAFASWLDAELPEGGVRPLTPETAEELRATLEGPLLEPAVRAALVLGRSRSEPGARILLEHLERRLTHSGRNDDAPEVVAAAALATHPDARRLARRLRDLAVGDRPHPDLEVRIECAVAALANGEEDVEPLLLRILYAGTWRDALLARDYEASPTSAWVRGRAATALSQRCGVPVTYAYDGPLADQEREADRLAELLGIELELRSPEAPGPGAGSR